MSDRNLQGCDVLVLEDTYLQAEEVCRLLTDAGARIVGPFRDAADAVASADRHKPSCALVDINLGRGPNFAPAKALIARAIPVAFLTGYDADAIPPELAAVPRLEKPAAPEDVLDVLARICQPVGPPSERATLKGRPTAIRNPG